MFDFQSDVVLSFQEPITRPSGRPDTSKRLFDLVVCLVLLIPLLVLAVLLCLLNPFFNRGPVFFCQERMGRHCRGFTAWKFRSMSVGAGELRGAFDPLETEGITRLGHFLRRSRIDELPQIINVLRGEMSLIGPRPDCFGHAQAYLRQIPGYAQRHRILPGISGLAQTEVGYVEGQDGIMSKVETDLYYLAHACFRLDMWIAWRTLCVVLGARGR
ncbi:MAG: sugar transferase [Yoonia sp.]|uniref:sugar transferase n=1 Tax=Yoonia sp. TaxID=2212373 RepID=UPI003EF7BA92